MSVLNYNHNIEAYIQEHMEEESTFYVLEKEFFDAWAMNIGFCEEKSYVIKKERKKVIDNAGLVEPGHEHRLREVSYGEEFMLVPKHVFYPFSKWYACTKTIERQVIKHSVRTKALSLFKHKKLNSSVMPPQQAIPDHFFKEVGDTTYELEVYPKFLYFEKINERGEKPH